MQAYAGMPEAHMSRQPRTSKTGGYMTISRFLRVIVGLGVLALVTAASALAQPPGDKRTVFTFDRPITLPGVTLPAGQYVFQLADTEFSRKVIHVSSADGKRHYSMLFSISDERAVASSVPEVRFMETAKGHPSAVKAWWYPNERIGYEFIYPKEQARRLALSTVEPVLTTREETKKPEETQAAQLTRLTPAGQETAVVAEARPVEPTGPSQTGVVASQAAVTPAPESQVARNELPRTASDLPLMTLLGALALAGAAGLRLFRAVRA